ncbi:hypothetical protein GCM10009555_103560 [Acrocarpospora macrocephala]|uniref:Carbohydrate kinase PfkB domain-containing protein n=1 Tax=Acrocarpospora macrocephala TaxID=150177 RepID=A0A5M3WG62_9ACTN|nr:hypothetical protein [Acrocarpospora macrocephala]GES07279.1 hypothetical protein Amac_008740 [Acrocarpospora macrocephala]
MTLDSKAHRWVVLGALHFDISTKIDGRWFALTEDAQTWTDIQAELGGVAGNIVRSFAEVREQVDLIAVVGDDPLGQLLLETADSAIAAATVWPAVIPRTRTGIVNIIHIGGGVTDARLMIAPDRSAVDSVRYSDVSHKLAELRHEASDLILDGYMLREQLDLWLDDLQVLKNDGWRIHLELVPHSGWQGLAAHTLDRLSMLCATISASLGTLEKILGLPSGLELGAEQRAARFAEHAQASWTESNARITGRFGATMSSFGPSMVLVSRSLVPVHKACAELPDNWTLSVGDAANAGRLWRS